MTEPFQAILLILVFGGIAGASSGGLLAIALIREIRRLERKYEKYIN